MKRNKTNLSVVLGIAFFTQALVPFISGAVLFDPLLKMDDIQGTMTRIALQAARVQWVIFLDMIASMVVILLGIVLYTLLKNENRLWSQMGMALYTLEAVMLVGSRLSVFALLRASQIFAISGDASLLSVGQLFLELNKFAYNLAMLPFGIGALLFYYQLYRTKMLPSGLMLWGLITVLPIMIGIPLMAFGVAVPFILMVPYVPFEFAAGIYLLIKGLPELPRRVEPVLAGAN